MKRTGISRRNFLKAAGVALAAPNIITSEALGADGRPPASDRIVMASIGVGGRGRGNMGSFMGFGQVQMVAVCDPMPAHAAQAKASVDKRYGNADCKTYADFREVLARPDIDAVMIGTPDHWHAIITVLACRAGKDVYCEKPESLTVREGRAMVDAVTRHGRVFSGGSQRVLGDYGDWPRLVWGGAIGKVKEAFISCGGPSGECHLPEQPLPEGANWDLWLGPAPWRPYNKALVTGGFRPYRDYSGGGMTDWGAHRFGAAMFACGVHETGPVEVAPPDGKDRPYLAVTFANGLKIHHGGTGNITYIGTDGQLPGPYRTPVARPDMPHYRGSGGIYGDFLHCVRTREKPFRHVEAAHRATTVCHLGNIAYWLNRTLKYDPAKEEIVGDAEANRWLGRPKREPWDLI